MISSGENLTADKLADQMDWGLVPGFLEEEARQCFIGGDTLGMLCTMGNTDALAFVFDNHGALIFRGIYENSLAIAYTGTRSNHAGWDLAAVRFLFDLADRQKLLAAGDQLPPGAIFKLFRGVAGDGKKRRPSGPSWTDDMEKAKWFALRFPHLADPAIYSATVRREDVLLFSNEREERDFIIFVKHPVRMKIDLKGQENAAPCGSGLPPV